MRNLSKEEEISFILSILLLIPIILAVISFRNTALEFLILGLDMITIATIIIYFFIIKPINIQKNTSISQLLGFSRPRHLKTKKVIKKTRLFGNCDFCGKQVQLGFTCSFCGNYFCPDHRLPEKHMCPKLR